MSKLLQIITQILFLLLFILLVFTGKMQLWMAIFLVGVTASMFLGRFYCGWICPINTVMKAVVKLKQKFGIGNLKIPDFLKSNYIRYGFLFAFIATFIIVMATGKKLPVLPYLSWVQLLPPYLKKAYGINTCVPMALS